jgi:hypothetical protein
LSRRVKIGLYAKSSATEMSAKELENWYLKNTLLTITCISPITDVTCAIVCSSSLLQDLYTSCVSSGDPVT